MRKPWAGAVVSVLVGGAVAQSVWSAPAAWAEPAPLRLSYVSTAELGSGTGVRIGGLSGLDFDARAGEFYAASDDKGEYGPARYYRVPAAGVLAGKPSATAVPLQGLAAETYDLEALRLLPNGNLLLTSEGLKSSGAAPFVREYTRDGALARSLPIPERYLPDYRSRGIRSNLGFEGAAVRGGTVSLLTESALQQDGKIADHAAGASARLLRLGLDGAVRDEFVYRTDPLPASVSKGDTGNAELVALNDADYLVIERGYDAVTKRNHVRIYWTTVSGAQAVTGVEQLRGTERAMAKKLVFDFASVPAVGNPDNVEGMTFGPLLPDGRRSLVLVSDDNFNKDQKTLFHVLAVG